MSWIKRHKGLIGILLLAVMALSLPASLGLTWVRSMGILDGDSIVFSANATALDKFTGRILHDIYGDQVQVCDYSSDETEINAAIDAMPYTYGTTRLKAGTFLVDGSVELQHGVRLIGAGKVATTLKCEASTIIADGIIHADGHWNRGELRNFTVDGNEDNAGDCMGVYLQGHWYSEVNNIEVKDCEDDGIYLSGPEGGGYSGECYYEFVEVHDISSDGWHISSVMDSFWIDCYEYNAEEDGFHIIGNANTFIHCHAWNDGWSSFELSSDAKHTNMVDCAADQPGMHGFKIASYENNFVNCGVGDASQHYTNYDGFRFASYGNNFFHCTVGNSGSGDAGYAFNEVSGGYNNVIEHCIITGTYDLGIMNVTGANSVVRLNEGYVTESEGSATIISGNTSVDVAHGLDVTPADGDVVATFCENPGSASKLWVGNYNSENFTIYFDADPGDNITVAWKAQAW